MASLVWKLHVANLERHECWLAVCGIVAEGGNELCGPSCDGMEKNSVLACHRLDRWQVLQ